MQFVAKSRFIRFSPYKLRPLADVIRGKSAQYALNWLSTYSVQRALPMSKMIQSAVANARQLGNFGIDDLVIKEIRVDEGPVLRYYKAGAMGRAAVLRRRLSHMNVILEPKQNVDSKVKKA